jgi:hypothetical protein
MRIIITESQYRVLVNKSRDVVFGNVNEGRQPKETPEEIDAKIEEIKNHVRNGGEFIRDEKKDDNYKWLYTRLRADKTKEQKFQNAFDQIKKIQEELENKKIREIKNHVRNGGEFGKKSDNKYYNWLYYKSRTDKTEEQKFQNALDQIKKIQEELENKKIKEILNHVRNGGEFTRLYGQDDNYKWLRNKSRSDKTEEQKFQNALDQIDEIQKKLGIKREWQGEKVIRDTLIGMGFKDIPRQGQHIYKDCRNSLTCKFYKFDIYLPYNENNYMIGKNEGFYIPETGIIFEYDGRQHFKPNEHFGGEEEFIKRIHGDKEKNSYCQNNNIKLVRIPHTSKTRIDIQNDIISSLKNPNTFILTGDYPKLGWNQK